MKTLLKKLEYNLLRHLLAKNLNCIEELVKGQCSNGNWTYDNYMHGMANGMILIQAIILNTTPKFLSAPKKWLFQP